MPAVILEAVRTIKPLTDTTFDQWVERYGESILPAFARNGYELLGWFKRSGGRLTDIWAFPGPLDLSYRPGDPLGDLVEPLRRFAPEETISYLNPLPGSPLQ